ncbi:MAG TPA: NADH-quinone oxidoreductase subunit C [Bacteroidota bacterium]|nr:NADH-quinone oxidoreductase subunit C [Bacteroidota bacterium]
MKDLLLQKLREQFPSAVEVVSEFRDELTLIIRKADILPVCSFLQSNSDLSFDSIRDLCGADYHRPDDRFEVIYNIYSLKNNFRLRLKVRIDEKDLHVASVSGIWQGANWLERESYDMYGILFDGHPDLRRIYLPEEFEYYPLRKDFPLMGIPGSLPLPRK